MALASFSLRCSIASCGHLCAGHSLHIPTEGQTNPKISPLPFSAGFHGHLMGSVSTRTGLAIRRPTVLGNGGFKQISPLVGKTQHWPGGSVALIILYLLNLALLLDPLLLVAGGRIRLEREMAGILATTGILPIELASTSQCGALDLVVLFRPSCWIRSHGGRAATWRLGARCESGGCHQEIGAIFVTHFWNPVLDFHASKIEG